MTKTAEKFRRSSGKAAELGAGSAPLPELTFLFQLLLSVFQQVIEFTNQLQESGMVPFFLN
jgi:hypothetical protein